MHAPLDPGTVRLRWLATDAIGDEHLPRWRAMLDDTERTRADRFFFAPDRDTFTAAHALLRAMLSEATGLSAATWRYVTGEFGKPVLSADCGACGLHFSLSHTRGLAACAIAHDELGLDVEAADRPTDFAIADSYFAPEEAALVAAAPPASRAALFFRLWTLKEAFIKATGEGLSRRLDSFAFSLQPLRITFRPERDATTCPHDPAAWTFDILEAAPARPLSLAVRRDPARKLRIDARAARPDEVAER